MSRSHPRWLGRLAFVASISVAGAVGAQEVPEVVSTRKIEIHLAKQSIGDALTALGQQTGLTIVVDSSVGHEVMTPELNGLYTATEALRKIIASTGLRAKYLDKHTVAIVGARDEVSSAARGIKAQGAEVAELSGPVSDEEPGADQRTPDQSRENSGAEPNGKLEQVVVTGSHIRGDAADTSPVTIYYRKDIEQTGAATVDQFVRTLPQNFSSIDASTPIYGSVKGTSGLNQLGSNLYGGSGINLNGLGVGATLTLVDGHRVAPAGASGAFVDVSLIPLSAVERVEILNDGASAIYGSDAIAGAVNFVLRKDFDGAETSIRYGAATGRADGEFSASQLFGHSWGTGNALLVYEHDKQDGLLSTDRSFIPDQGNPSHILPEQKRNSVLASGRQELAEGATLSGNAFYSKRDYDSSISSTTGPGMFVQNITTGNATTYGTSLAVGKDLPLNWRVELSGNYAKLEQSSTQTFNPPPDSSVPVLSADNTQLVAAQLNADGSLWSLPGGDVKAAVGGEFRSEGITHEFVAGANSNSRLSRHVGSAYGEVLIPLIGELNRQGWAQRLELSSAARYEHYSDFGSTTNPKVGLLWSPVRGLNIRVTYSTSFQAPLLDQLVRAPDYFTFNIPNPAAPSGFTDTLVSDAATNPNLHPERAKSFTAGFDIKPPALPSFSLAANYFHINFTERFAAPPVQGSFFSLFSQTEALGHFINNSPTLAEVTSIFATGAVGDFATDANGNPLGPQGVRAIFNDSLINVASTIESGLNLRGTYGVHTGYGDVGMSLAGNYILQNDFKTLPTTPTIVLLNSVGQPVDLRMRGSLSWSRGGLASSLTVNYTSGYKNDLLTPVGRVSAWTTLDAQMSYTVDSRASPSLLSGFASTLSIMNLADRPPPSLAVPIDYVGRNAGYDPTNASPLGRIISLQIQKRW
jgi:iron complex outermembrane receptor protein